ncbi:DUF2231 domain-containing protein [Sulfoacidibacillus thermotolerans]|uniref:DUF2231 domain-containing protein n=1 Tax=Sulfoacidibacillus thermotolerans TaxID=1765684 RepID=A0A2U3D7F2_SULT2|nr:DUF2231 domain-containing protein [Sulfoacidibacillus thermotolerans]PWI57212.1 hypothetical protein BM613_09470 [Sulfoacidibacillus thermotolerans]
MAFLQGVWNGILTAWIAIGTRLFPHTIHPMIVHFPIVLLYLALFVEIVRYGTKNRRDRFFDRASFWILTLSLFALVATALAGILAEQYVKFTPATEQLLSAHQRDAVLTGVFALAAWVVRVFSKYPMREAKGREQAWSLFRTGRGRSSLLATFLLLLAVIMVSITGSLGGTMVYHYGVGTPKSLKIHQVASGHLSSAASAR